MNSPVLSLQNLHISFGDHLAVDRLSLQVQAGEFLALVGESGSGKTLTAMAIGGLAPATARIEADAIQVTNKDLLHCKQALRRQVLGQNLAYVFQEPMTSLNPVLRVSQQMAEVIRHHTDWPRERIEEHCITMLGRMQIEDPARIYRSYPHELSGGLRQRVMIATALLLDPAVLIADEPTTALDVTVQREIMDLLADLKRDLGIAILFITHDLDLVQAYADRVAVMYAGQIVEEGSASEVLSHAHHPYTQGLLLSTPRFQQRGEAMMYIKGRVEKRTATMQGCPFATRCPFAQDPCRTTPPEPDTNLATSPRCLYPRTELDRSAWQEARV